MTDLSGVDPNPNPDPGNYIIGQRRAAQGAAIGALDANPDDAARALLLSESTGAHPALIDADLEGFEKQYKARLTSEILNNNPYLRDYVNSHPLAAKVSNDDFGQLDVMSHHLQAAHPPKGSVIPGIQTAVLANPMLAGVAANLLPETWDSIKEGLGQIVGAPGALVGIGTDKKPQEEMEQYLLKQGVPGDIAKREAALVQQRMDRGQGLQGPIFGAMQILSSTGIGAFRHLITQPLEEQTGFPAQATEGLTFAALGFLGLRGGMKAKPVQEVHRAVTAAEPFVKAGVEPPVGIDPLIDELHSKQTEIDLEHLDGALKESQRSATRERNPEMFARFVRAHTDSRISVSAEAIRKLYGERAPTPDDGILGWAPDIDNQLRIAEARGGDVQIPLADWLAKVDPGVAKELHDDIRVRGNGLTLNEVRELGEPTAQKPQLPAIRQGTELEPTTGEPPQDKTGFSPSQMRTLLSEEQESLINMWHEVKEPRGENLSAHRRMVLDAYGRELDKNGILQASTEEEVRDILFEKRGERVKATQPEKIESEASPPAIEDSLRRSGALDPQVDRLDPEAAKLARVEQDLGLEGGQWVDLGKSGKMYVKPGEKYTAYEKQIHEAVNEVLDRVLPRRVEYGGTHALTLKGETVHGFYQEYAKNRPVLLWALESNDPVGTARHEAIHALYRGGFFTDSEWTTLKGAAVEGEWIKKHDIVQRYPGESLDLHLEEAIADEYASWAKSDRNAGSVHPIFEKMKKLILELRDKIKDILGEEPTADKLFEKVEAGVIRDREGAKPRDPGAFAAQRPPVQGELDVTRLEDREVYGRKVFEGLPKKLYDRWIDLINKRDEEDTAYGAKKAEKEVAKRQTQEWKDASAKIRDEIKPDFVNRPDIAADEFLRSGVLYGDKVRGRPRLDVDQLMAEQKAALPEDYYEKGGLNPDDVAGLFGYPTGEALVERLSALVKDRGEAGPKEYVNKLLDSAVERRMQAEHGDLAANILEEAQDHVISQTQLDILHQEVVGLGMKAGVLDPDAGITITQADMRRWVKSEFDQQPLSSHNVQRYLRDAGRAGNKAINALVTDDPKEAIKFKQQQQISFMMANEAKALEKAQKSFERNAKLMSRREVPSVQQDYTNFIHDILTRVGKPVRRSVQDLAGTIAAGEWANLEDFVNYKQQHDLREVPIADFLLDPTFRVNPGSNTGLRSFGDLTTEQFKAVHDSIKALLANGRDEKKIYKAGEAADLQVIKDQLVGELKEFEAKARLDPSTVTGKMKHYARTFLAAHLQLESLFNRWDRGDPQGAWTQYVMRDLASAANSEAALERKYSRLVAGLADKVDLNEKVRNTIFHDPFTFERDPETGRMGPGDNSELLNFTRKNLRAVLQNAGNASNLEKLARGYGLNPELVMAWLHKYATKADWDWAQKQGDIFKEIKKESDRMYRNLTDIEPEAVDIQPIQTPHGTYDGWYHPVVYDPVWEGTSKKLIGGDPLEQDNYVRATTPAGYTKVRTGYVAPMSLYLDQTPARMKQMLHDIAFRPAVINASKIFYDKDVRAAISKHYGPEYRDLLVPWLKDVANSSNSRSDVQKVGAQVSEFFRQNMIATLIGFNPGTVMKHGPTAAMNSLTEVGPMNFAKAVAGLFSKNEATGETNWRFAMDTSEELARRHRHYVETIKGADEKVMGTSSMRETMIKLGSYPVAMSDLLSAVPTWLAKYETSMREGADHGTAVFDADRAVRRAHGSSVITNRPAVMRGGAMAQWMSSLYGFFSHILNRQFEMAWKAKDTLGLAKEGEFKEAMSRTPELTAMFFSYVVFPAVIEELVTPLGDDKHESWGVKAGKALAHSLSGSWIGLRDLVNGMVSGRDPSAGLMSTAFKTISDTFRDMKKDQPMSKQHAGTFLQHFITMVGGLTGLTNAQEGRVAKLVYNYSTGQEKPKGFAQWWHGLRFGTVKEGR